MQLSTSYKQILAIALPIMLGSAAQNLVALSDSVFLYYLGQSDFAAIGFVGVFYLMVSAIGYGFSKGGQIIIARRMGESNAPAVGATFRSLVLFELALAIFMFVLMRWGCPFFFKYLINSPEIYKKSLEFLHYRSYGVFFSYLGVAMVALYTGIARTRIISYDTLVLAILNIGLCYALVFGNWGFPRMGIAGAGLASTIAEACATIVFVVYMLFDKENRYLQIFRLAWPNIKLIQQQAKMAMPVVAQSVVGLGSWFIFFSIIETRLGENSLAVTNFIRLLYLALSIPCWGFASAINTIVSNFLGQQKWRAVLPMTIRTSILSLASTLILAIPICLFPKTVLAPFATAPSEAALLLAAEPVLVLLLFILILFSVGSVFFNAIAGCGATFFGLQMQFICAILYLVYVYVVVHVLELNLTWAWSAELMYWVLILFLSYAYLRSGRWVALKV